jgi:hypothetical protein
MIMSETYPCRLLGYFKLINFERGGWAKNFPARAGRPPFVTETTVHNNFASVYEHWTVEQNEEGYTIINQGSGYYLTAYEGEAVGSSQFEKADSK